MKRILLLLTLSVIVCSCATVDLRTPYSRYHGVVDYSSYLSRGFFITESNSVNFDYEPIGSITAVVQSGWEVLDRTNQRITSNDDVYGTYNKSKVKYGDYLSATLDDAIEELYTAAIALGANGVINFRITSTEGEYVASGMVIKR